MSLLSLLKKPHRELAVVFDIGSHSVGGALVLFETKQKPTILYTTREQISFQKIIVPNRFVGLMRSALENVSLHLQKYGLEHLRLEHPDVGAVSHIVCALSSPWHDYSIQTLKTQDKKPFLVTHEVIQKMLSAEKSDAGAANLKTANKKPAPKPKALSVIERKITDVKINGYPVISPFGKTGTSLEISLFQSEAPVALLDQIKKSIGASFDARFIEFHTFPLNALLVVREIIPEIKDYLLVHVGGELTDVMVIENGKAIENLSFPLGHNFLARNMSTALGESPGHVAKSFVTLIMQGDDERLPEKARGAFNQAKEDWLTLLRDTLAESELALHLPNECVLVTEKEYMPTFETFLKDDLLGKMTGNGAPMTIKTVNDQSLANLIVFGRNAVHDPLMGIVSLVHTASLDSPEFTF